MVTMGIAPIKVHYYYYYEYPPVLCFVSRRVAFAPAEFVELLITTVSNAPATVTVSIPKFDPTWNETISVARGGIRMVQIPTAIRGQGTEKVDSVYWSIPKLYSQSSEYEYVHNYDGHIRGPGPMYDTFRRLFWRFE